MISKNCDIIEYYVWLDSGNTAVRLSLIGHYANTYKEGFWFFVAYQGQYIYFLH